MRKIIHIDMDAFFASVEQRDNPALRGKPVIVGGAPDSRGVVAAVSYEARPYGVRSAMPCHKAYRLCPHAIFVPPRFAIYQEVSQQIRELMLAITPLVEPLSLDEAYLDVTEASRGSSATAIAETLRAQIRRETGLTASAGVSCNKMLAKIASDLNKPDGIAVITPAQAYDFLARLPVERIHGIGNATLARLHELGIKSGADLQNTPHELLVARFGKRGEYFHAIARGIDERPVSPMRERKSVGSETTFARDSADPAYLREQLRKQSADAFATLRRKQLCARTLTIKIKYADFSQITRSHTASRPFRREKEAHYWLDRLFANAPRGAVRLVGVSYSTLESANRFTQPDLFPDNELQGIDKFFHEKALK